MSRLLKRALDKLELKSNRIAQWDSWRFWEALAAGCVAFHIDLEKYGAVLLVMPEKWKHYVGVDLDDFDSVFEKFIDNLTFLEKISLDVDNGLLITIALCLQQSDVWKLSRQSQLILSHLVSI